MLFSCISFRTRYDERVTKKKERTPSRQRPCSLLRSLLRSNRSRSSMLMIRRFSIFCKLNEIKFSDRKWFEDAAGMPLPPDQPCPYCLAKGTLRLFGHYNRYLVEWDGNTQKCSTVTVQRYICDSCGHTHAILPSCIVPYRSYSLRFLLIVLRAYFTRPGSVERLCDHYGITISMLYRWLRLFQQQKALWLGGAGRPVCPCSPIYRCYGRHASERVLSGVPVFLSGISSRHRSGDAAPETAASGQHHMMREWNTCHSPAML